MDIKTQNEYKAEQHKATQTAGRHEHKIWIGTYIVLAISCLAIYGLFRLNIFVLPTAYTSIILKLSLAAFFCFVALIVAKISESIVIKKTHTKSLSYNIVRLIRLLALLVIVFLIISFINENWYTAAVSLGLISLILGFALQSPIASLIGWFYIVIRTPYKVGDRIQVQDFTGDVVEINYLDTTLWEFAGTYMSNDVPSGRLIRFPNSFVWQCQIFNYSWKKFPYIWNEIPFYLAFQSDLAYVEKIIRNTAKEALGDSLESKVKEMRSYIKETPVDELEIKEYPFVSFCIHPNTWVEAMLIYLVDPKKASAIRSELVKKILHALSAHPEKVMLPKSDAR